MEHTGLDLEMLGSLLDSFNNQVHSIEDMYVAPDERFQAKLHLVKGMLDCLGMELAILEAEKDDLVVMQEDEQEQLDLFKGSHESYKSIMEDLFKI
jgi:hypothetical protein